MVWNDEILSRSTFFVKWWLVLKGDIPRYGGFNGVQGGVGFSVFLGVLRCLFWPFCASHHVWAVVSQSAATNQTYARPCSRPRTEKIRDRKNRISNREISGVFTGMGAEVEKNLTPGYQTGAKFDKNTWKAQTLFDAQRVKYKVAQTAEPLSRNRFLIIHSSCLLRIY